MKGSVITGRLATGIGQGARFTSLEWAHRQFIDQLGINAFPGTINIVVDGDSADIWARLRRQPGVRIANPDAGAYACDARCYPVTVGPVIVGAGIAGAIVYPEVESYAQNLIEVISATGLRAALGISDGDQVRLVVR